MYIILGATGHIGSVVAEILIQQGEKVTIVTRSDEKAQPWKKKGAEVAVLDISDTAALHKVFAKCKRVFLLNPPAMPASDMIAEEQKTMRSMLKALENTTIEKIVAESTYGAQPGSGNGDLNTLYDMEEGIKKTGIPATIIRGAYYMTNWDMQLESAQQTGIIHTMLPAGFNIPMVDPADIGEYAAKLLLEPADKTGLHFVEGPEAYSPADVAAAFGEALQKRVEAVETPESQWVPAMIKAGFSKKGAEAMANMTRLTLNQNVEAPGNPHRGKTTLTKYISQLVHQQVKETA